MKANNDKKNPHREIINEYFNSSSLAFMKTNPNCTASSSLHHICHLKAKTTLNHTQSQAPNTTAKANFKTFYKLNKGNTKSNQNGINGYSDTLYTRPNKRARPTSNDNALGNPRHSNNGHLFLSLNHIKHLPDGFNSLRDIYSECHSLGRKNNKTETFIKKKREVFKKYDIERKLTKDQSRMLTKHFGKNKQNNATRNVNIIDQQYFKDQFQSLKKITINKQLRDQIQLELSNEQIMRYLHLENAYNDYRQKESLMPKVKIKDTSPDEMANCYDKRVATQSNSLLNSQTLRKENGQQGSELANIANLYSDIKRISLFNEYNSFEVSYVSHCISKPNSRASAKMVLCNYYGTKKLYLFGGINTHRLNDLWECDISTAYKWQKVTDVKGDYPSSRGGHTVSFNKVKRKLYVIGGDYHETPEEVLIYDIASNAFSSFNTSKSREEPIPVRRKNHIAESIGDYIIVYGGRDVSTDSTLNDIWGFDVLKETWIKAYKLNGIQMPKLSSCASTLVISSSKKNETAFSLINRTNALVQHVKDKRSHKNFEGIYIFGGCDEYGEVTNKTYALLLGKPLECVEIQTQGSCPQPRCDCTINYNEKLNGIILYGGRSNSKTASSFFRDIYILDIELLNWTKMIISNGNIDKRAHHSTVSNDYELIVFGGINEKIYLKSDIMIINLNIFSKAGKDDDDNKQLCQLNKSANQYPNAQKKPLPNRNPNRKSTNNVSPVNHNKLVLNKKQLFQDNYLKGYSDKTKEIREKVNNIRKEHSEIISTPLNHKEKLH